MSHATPNPVSGSAAPLSLLVTGGAGYIGSHVTRRLVAAGHSVVVLDDLSHGHREAVAPAARLVVAGTGDEPAVHQLLGEHRFDAVLHFAASIEVGESVREPVHYYRNNFANGLSLLSAMLAHGVRRFIFSSTAAIYGDPKRTPIDEAHPTEPINPYGRSKLALEWLLSDLARAAGLSYAALRYFNVAGAAPDHAIGEAHEPETHLIPRVLAAAAGTLPHVEVYGTDYPTADGTCIRDYIHVEDLATAHLLALDRVVREGGAHAFNLGSEAGFSVRQVIDTCREVTGREIPVRTMPRRPGDPAVLVASSAKIQSELGWTFRHPDLATLVRHAWEWDQNRPAWARPANAS
jgi:UDP-glucose 4-epimerase